MVRAHVLSDLPHDLVIRVGSRDESALARDLF